MASSSIPGFSDRDWIHQPRQQRSRETARRILAATAALLEKQSLERISVAQIAGQAGISVGGFYARFPSKDALLHAFDEQFVGLLCERLESELEPGRWRVAGPAGAIEAYVRTVFEFFTRYRSIARQVLVQRQVSEDPTHLERMQGLELTARRLLRRILEEHRSALSHEDPDQGARYGILFVTAALREAVLVGRGDYRPTRAGNRRLIKELTRAWCAYLGIAGTVQAGT